MLFGYQAADDVTTPFECNTGGLPHESPHFERLKMPEFSEFLARDGVANCAGQKRACASRSIGWNRFMIF